MKNNYSIKVDNEKMAKALGKDLPISMKFSTQLCNAIRKKSTQRAKIILQEIMDLKKALPMKRYNKDLAHQKATGPGRYPVNAASHILKVVEQVEKNAQFKGLDIANLQIIHIKVDKAATPWHYGRKRRRKMKRSHIEIVVKEKESDKKETKNNKAKKEETKEKTEIKKAAEEKGDKK